MIANYWQATHRPNGTISQQHSGRRAYLLANRNLAEVARRRERGQSLAAAIRQFEASEIDAETLRDAVNAAEYARRNASARLAGLLARDFAVCEDCDQVALRDGCHCSDSKTLCEDCAENYFTCEDCGDLTHSDQVTSVGDDCICDHCLAQNYTSCDDCGEYERDDSVIVIDSNSVCRHCLDNGDYYYWESDGEYHAEPEPEDELIREYNVTLTGAIGRLPADRRAEHVLGAELELEVGDRQAFAEAIDYEHSPNDCHCKHDGSLNSAHGIEVVTGHGTFASLCPILESIVAIARGHDGKSHDGGGCGLHIGLDRSQFAPLLQAKIIVFWNNGQNYAFLRQFTRRDYRRNDYCRAKAEKTTRGFLHDPDLASRDKYELVNTRHASHLEFRAFRGSLLPRTLRACLALVSLTASFCDQAQPEPNDLTTSAFIHWLQTNAAADDRTAAVIDYLANRGKRLADYAC